VVGIGAAFLLGDELQDLPFRKPGAQVWTPAVLIGLCGVIVQNAANGLAGNIKRAETKSFTSAVGWSAWPLQRI
jgi:hypothetical protein